MVNAIFKYVCGSLHGASSWPQRLDLVLTYLVFIQHRSQIPDRLLPVHGACITLSVVSPAIPQHGVQVDLDIYVAEQSDSDTER